MGTQTVVEGHGSAWSSVFNLANCAIGAGVLAFPYAFRAAGALGGILVCIVLALLEGLTLRVVVFLADRYRVGTYPGMVRRGLGPASSLFMSGIILFYLFGSCVIYLIIVGSCFTDLSTYYLAKGDPCSPFANRELVIGVLGVTLLLPFCLRRTMKALAGISTIAVGVMFYTMVVVVAQAVLHLWHSPDPFAKVVLFNWNIEAFYAVPIIVFAFHCHIQSVPIFYELEADPVLLPCLRKRPRAPVLPTHTALQATADASVSIEPVGGQKAGAGLRKRQGMYNVILFAYLECGITYIVVGLAGYLLFQDQATDDIIDNFPKDDGIIQFTRLLLGLAVLFHFPVNQHVARYAWDNLLRAALCLPWTEQVPRGREIFNTLLFFAATMATAMSTSSLGAVFQVAGGVAGSLMIFILPGLILMRDLPGPGEGAHPDAQPLLEALTSEASEPPIAAARVAASGAASRAPPRRWMRRLVGGMLVVIGTAVLILALCTCAGVVKGPVVLPAPASRADAAQAERRGKPVTFERGVEGGAQAVNPQQQQGAGQQCNGWHLPWQHQQQQQQQQHRGPVGHPSDSVEGGGDAGLAVRAGGAGRRGAGAGHAAFGLQRWMLTLA